MVGIYREMHAHATRPIPGAPARAIPPLVRHASLVDDGGAAHFRRSVAMLLFSGAFSVCAESGAPPRHDEAPLSALRGALRAELQL